MAKYMNLKLVSLLACLQAATFVLGRPTPIRFQRRIVPIPAQTETYASSVELGQCMPLCKDNLTAHGHNSTEDIDSCVTKCNSSGVVQWYKPADSSNARMPGGQMMPTVGSPTGLNTRAILAYAIDRRVIEEYATDVPSEQCDSQCTKYLSMHDINTPEQLQYCTSLCNNTHTVGSTPDSRNTKVQPMVQSESPKPSGTSEPSPKGFGGVTAMDRDGFEHRRAVSATASIPYATGVPSDQCEQKCEYYLPLHGINGTEAIPTCVSICKEDTTVGPPPDIKGGRIGTIGIPAS